MHSLTGVSAQARLVIVVDEEGGDLVVAGLAFEGGVVPHHGLLVS